MVLVGAAFADEVSDAPATESVMQRETLTDGWFGNADALAERGVSVCAGVTQVYHANVRGGLDTHRRSGRYTGSYDLEIEVGTEAAFGLPGGTVLAAAEGSWSDGIDQLAVGSLFGINDDAGGDRSIDVAELWYEQALMDGKLRFRLGKIDISGGFECRHRAGAFDASAYANDETTQFLNGALVNNGSIPFPDNGLGIVACIQPAEWWYVAAGVADALADARESGFNMAFGGGNEFFSIYEAGIVPNLPSPNGAMPGAYRIGIWYDPQPKDRFDGRGAETDDLGFYISVDQMVLKENADDRDSQGLGLFARYGLADGDVNQIECFWSIGGQYQGLIPTRDDDVLGFGIAQGCLSDDAGYTASHETAMEAYYNARITGWLNVTPFVQCVLTPGGDEDVDEAVIAGIRAQLDI